ncbi:MAG: hypothetical protein MZU97_11305 [Bacillus subtilis]|nr:hypothetical protein [Bacillus subtilis]
MRALVLYRMTDALLRLVAPLIPHTASEAYGVSRRTTIECRRRALPDAGGRTVGRGDRGQLRRIPDPPRDRH